MAHGPCCAVSLQVVIYSVTSAAAKSILTGSTLPPSPSRSSASVRPCCVSVSRGADFGRLPGKMGDLDSKQLYGNAQKGADLRPRAL
jgi:hypothetical protein